MEDKVLEALQNQDSRLVSPFLRNKLETEAQRNWDLFYKRNGSRFFKDRHWTVREFQELLGDDGVNESPRILLEVGCGVGNLAFPLLEELENLEIIAVDLSPRAIGLLKSHPSFGSNRIRAFVCDITQPLSLDFNKELGAHSCRCHLATLIFTLSSIHPQHYSQVMKNLFRYLLPGGLLLLRDYGRYDMAQLRFKPGHKIFNNFYMRQDGTRSYFFSTEELKVLGTAAGFHIKSLEYVHRRTVNLKEGIDVPRIFVQAKFMKPLESLDNKPN